MTLTPARRRVSRAKRGEVWIPPGDDERSLVTAVAHTTSARGGRFEVAVRALFLKAGVFDAQNLVTIPEARLIRSVGTLRPDDLASIESAVRAWLGL